MKQSKSLHLGELEREVLDYLWEAGKATAKEVHEVLGVRRQITLNTIQSTLERLYRKEILSRAKTGHAWAYTPDSDRSDILARKLDELVTDLASGDVRHLLSAFVEFSARLDKQSVDELARLIEEHRTRNGGDSV